MRISHAVCVCRCRSGGRGWKCSSSVLLCWSSELSNQSYMSSSSGNFFRAMAAAVVVVFLALAIVTAVTKAPWCDEGWFASPGWNLAFRGFMGTTVLDPASGTPTLHTRTRTDGIDRYTYWVMPLSLVAQAGWYKLAGFSLLRMR